MPSVANLFRKRWDLGLIRQRLEREVQAGLLSPDDADTAAVSIDAIGALVNAGELSDEDAQALIREGARELAERWHAAL